MKKRIFLISCVLIVFFMMSFIYVYNTIQKGYRVEKNNSIIRCETTNNNKKISTLIQEIENELQSISNVEEIKEWFVLYKNITEQYQIFLYKNIYNEFSSEELDMLFAVVQAEIGDEYSFEQKVHVANVIFNRMYHESFPNTLSEILISSQFSTISNGRYKTVEVSEDTILACEYAFMFGDTTNGALFFDSNGVLNYEFIYNDGAHNFYKLRRN